MSNRSLPRRLAGVTAVIAALAVTSACGGDDNSNSGGHDAGAAQSATSSAQPGMEHNQADITFAQSMIAHHQQAIEMAAMAESKATNSEVKALATKIKQAQGPEIEEMNQWLSDWGASPAAMPTGESHGEMPGMGSMPGAMTAEEMAKLSAATGANFDRMFLEMMIRHHEGAIEMARTEQQQGLNPGAKALAQAIDRDQTAEITEMRALLAAV
jgi:uncharacterized protein (DUF305 family)